MRNKQTSNKRRSSKMLEMRSKNGDNNTQKAQKTKVIAKKKTAPAEGGIKARRFKPGTVALREIKKY
jgi:hypothetical protein